MRHILLAAVALVLLTTAAIAYGATSPAGPFTFASGVPGTTFECSVDGSVYKSCFSPYSPAVYTGAHTLLIREKFTTTTTSPPPPPPPSDNHCFASPHTCGYPDPSAANVGALTACSSLTPSGPITASAQGQTVEGLNITGGVTVTASNVTLANDCITTNGDSQPGSRVVTIANGATATRIEHSTISGANSTSQSVEEALNNNYSQSGSVADHDYIYNCGECVHGPWKLTNSYVMSNATISGEHYEDIYCSDATFVAEHDVLINPHEQTANLFCDTNGGGGGAADNHITLTNSLLAGSGFSLYTDGNSTSVGSSTMTVTGNRFTRCLSTSVFNQGSGGTSCAQGPDGNGYFPKGGYFGIAAYTYCSGVNQVWTNNVWDDDGVTVEC
jgi:hypothetical protein